MGRLRTVMGGTLLAGGVLLVSFAGTRYVDGAARAAAARDAWEAARVHDRIAAVRRGSYAASLGQPLEPGAPVARLRIPRLDLDEIVVEGVGNEELNVGPGHIPWSALPGQPGNAIISAHRDRHFLPLEGLVVGDTVVTELGPDATRWVVVARRIVDAGSPALFATREPTLTLTTCWPIRFFGPAPERLVITARPVNSPTPAKAA